MARRKRHHQKRKKSFGLKKKTVFSIVGSALFLLALLITLSFFQRGAFLAEVNFWLWQHFGFLSLLLPFLLLCYGFWVLPLKTLLSVWHISLGASVAWLALAGLFKSGLFGHWLWQQVAFWFTGPGALIFFIFGALVGLLVLFDTSLENIFLWGWQIVQAALKLIRRPHRRQPELIKDETSQQPLAPPSLPLEKPKEKVPAKMEEVPAGPPPVLKKPAESNLPAADKLLTQKERQRVWQYPPLEIFDETVRQEADRGNVRANADKIEKTLDSFGIIAKVKETNFGPAVTQYALEVASGTKLSRLTALADNLALALAAPTGQIRIEAPIPGRSLVGIEVPNRRPEIVPLRDLLASPAMQQMKSKLAVPVGKSVSGQPVVTDISRMPHILIAGQTGSGKSVLLRSWITTLLFRANPDEVRLILVDPKRVEMAHYEGAPHLLTPVIYKTDEVISALKWAVQQMEERYETFTQLGVRSIDAYNELAGIQRLPYIVIVIDEMADLMLYAPAEMEDTIARLAQMARATGIHLILATQRPTVNIITGLIKSNVPARISFAVASAVDSRVILDTAGAEKLLGRGDMLFLPPDQAKPLRLQGPFVSDGEVRKLLGFLRQQGEAEYDQRVLCQPVKSSTPNRVVVNGQERDELFATAARLIIENREASVSLIQRHLHVGFARAGRIMDELAAAGIVGPKKGTKPRDILVNELPPELAE